MTPTQCKEHHLLSLEAARMAVAEVTEKSHLGCDYQRGYVGGESLLHYHARSNIHPSLTSNLEYQGLEKLLARP